MKHLHHSRRPITAAVKKAILTAPLLFCAAFTFAANTTEPALADPDAVITLYQTKGTEGDLSCSKDLPAMGGLTPFEWLPKQVCPRDEDADDKDKTFKAHSIRIRNMPIKSKVLLVNRQDCQKGDDRAWIELDTTRANASLEKMGIDKLWTYAGSAEKPGYVTNNGSDSQVPSFGVRIIGKGTPIKSGELFCVLVTIPKRYN